VHWLMLWSYKRPYAALSILAAGTIAFAVFMNRLHLDTSNRVMLAVGDSEREVYRQVVERFGSDNVTLVYVEDPDLFTPAKLARASDLAWRLERLDGVEKVQSLFTTASLLNEDGVLVTGPVLQDRPVNLEEAQRARQRALANPIMRGTLISERAPALAIAVYADALAEGGRTSDL
jgi:predicted RND superfamily exporter protein